MMKLLKRILICNIMGHKRLAKTIVFYSMEDGIKTPHGTAMCKRCGKDPLWCSDYTDKSLEIPDDVIIEGKNNQERSYEQ